MGLDWVCVYVHADALEGVGYCLIGAHGGGLVTAYLMLGFLRLCADSSAESLSSACLAIGSKMVSQ